MSAEKTLKFLLVGEDRSASRALKGVGDATDESARKFDAWKAAGVAAATATVVALGKFGMDSVQAFAEADAQARILQDAFARFPALADSSVAAMQAQAAAIQQVTGADGDAINAAQGMIAAYGLTGQQITDLTPLLVDYAAKTGKDVTSAAEDLGKAMLGQGRALKDVGIDFQDTGSVAGNFEQIMAGLSTQVGGFAEKEGASAEGQLQILKETFGDLQEEVGSKLLPVLTELVGVGLRVIEWVRGNIPLIVTMGGVLTAMAAAVALGNLQMAIAAAGSFPAYLASTNLVKVATAAWTGVQWAMNAALSANPIGLVVVAIAALVAAVVIAYRESETFRNVVQSALDGVYAAWQWLWNNGIAPVIRFILNGFASITEGIARMLDGLGNIPGFEWAKTAADKMNGAAAAARSMAAGINDIPDRKTVTVTLDGQITAKAQSILTAKSGGTLNTRVFARGGFAAPGWAIVGEEGPELVDFRTPGRVYTADQTRAMLGNTVGDGSMPGGVGGGGLTINVVVPPTADRGAIGREIVEAIRTYKRQAGGLTLGIA